MSGVSGVRSSCDRVQARVGDADRGRAGEDVRDLDVVGVELTRGILGVHVERADKLAGKRERDGENAHEPFRPDEPLVPGRSGSKVEDDVLVGALIDLERCRRRDALAARVGVGEPVVRADDQSAGLLVGQHHRARVSRLQLARRARDRPEAVREFDGAVHVEDRLVDQSQALLGCHAGR